MKRIIIIPDYIYLKLQLHLFKGNVEQAAFLFSNSEESKKKIMLIAYDAYLVHSEGWDVQMNLYLEMKDEERAKIMKMARDRKATLIECHSHRESQNHVCFSPSDLCGLKDFVPYARWKLDGKPYAALVWNESSVDARMWEGDFEVAYSVDEIQITGYSNLVVIPTWTKSLINKKTPYDGGSNG